MSIEKYICTKPLALDKYDDDGFFVENEIIVIDICEVWEVVEVPYNFVAPNEAIRLERAGAWCEILPETLGEYFEQHEPAALSRERMEEDYET